jgi:hypothetical protein
VLDRKLSFLPNEKNMKKTGQSAGGWSSDANSMSRTR